jgi:hypothetical protein
MALARQQSSLNQNNSLGLYIESPSPSSGRQYPRIERARRCSVGEEFVESMKALSTAIAGNQRGSANSAVIESYSRLPSQPMHGSSRGSRIPEKNGGHQSGERLGVLLAPGPRDDEYPAESIRKYTPVISTLDNEGPSVSNRYESFQLPPGREREISARYRGTPTDQPPRRVLESKG